MDVADTLSRVSLSEKFVDSELIDDMEVVVHKSSTDRREARTNEIWNSSRWNPSRVTQSCQEWLALSQK